MLTELQDGMMLYHASYTEIRNIDLTKCEPSKDFGKGFYLTSDYKQAEQFLKQSIKRAKIRNIVSEDWNKGIISCYKYHASADLNIKYFYNADIDWLHFIVSNRKNNIFSHLLNQYSEYDIIGGKIANDITARTIQTYLNQGYGEPGSDIADRIIIELLLPDRLKDQFCFKNTKAISCLEFVKGDVYGNL